ncbi:MATE family efflux transporter [Aquimarina aquimarini]|uniref:MATE family efflux transporter n=1 Tax=Aquimarina aquimarini TaxID=1191734 RepID=UPI000D5533E6|nr:MATE family efflux transporter [Aquimarina aquimarini]
MNKRPDILKDNLWKLMWKLSLPGILGMMVISINSLVDSIYVSYFIGADAFAGVSLLFPLTLVITSVTVFIAAGSSSVLSRAIGADDKETQQKVLPNLIALSMISSIIIIGGGVFFSEELVAVMGGTDAMFEHGISYFKVYILGAFFNIYGLSANGLIRSEGKIKQAMTFTVMSVILNIMLTPLFIHTFSMSIEGAAWSSIVSMLIYAIATSLYFIKGKASFNTGRFKIGIEKDIIKDVMNIGTSAFVMQLSNVVKQFFLFRTLTWYGTPHDITFFSAAFRLFSFLAIPVLGLLQPMQPIIGINYGASNIKRCIEAVKVFRIGSILFVAVLMIPVLFFPEYCIQLLLPDIVLSSADIINLRSILAVLLLLPIASSGIILFQATGKGKLASLLPIGRQVVLFLPLILFLPRLYNVDGIYYALILENVLYALLVWIVSRNELRKFSEGISTEVALGK